MKTKISLILTFWVIIYSGSVFSSSARDYISIVGSSTVYPFSTVVAEQFGKTSKFKTPKVESTGSGGGLKLFCSGIGVNHPDIANSSRQIKKSEQKKCAKNGIKDIIEIKIGYDGVVIANSNESSQYELSQRDIFLALAKQIPGPDGFLIDNPNKNWRDVNKSLPNTKIEVLGPPPTSGTRDAFVELTLEIGAKKFNDLKALSSANGPEEVKPLMKKLGVSETAYNAKGKKVFQAIAHAIREDGAYIEAGENDNLIIQKLVANPKALGIFGYSFLEQNEDKVQGSLVNQVAPTFDNIADGSYPVSRGLYFYVKNAHIGKVPGIAEFLVEFTSNKAWDEEGYLSEKGLIPMSKTESKKFNNDAKNFNAMKPL